MNRMLGRRAAGALVLTAGVLALGAGSGNPASASGGPVSPARTAPVSTSTTTCSLGNGVSHVVEITFDNVHFFRDNPNVPSDLELMPHLLQFIEQSGTMLSNNHTPLIAHTSDDSLTTYTGLYGDRHGQPVGNSYRTFNPDGTTDPASSFAYWTDPVFDTASHPTAGHDTTQAMLYSKAPPATTSPAPPSTHTVPAPWVPFTRAGCNVGEVATANMELENTAVDLPKVFGPNSPEVKQLAADPDFFKDPETADYVGIGVHCAAGATLCSTAEGVKFGEKKKTPTAVVDRLPDEPGGYHGFQALFGHRFVAPQLGAGTPDVTNNGYEVTNAAGNLVDLNGNEIDGAFLSNYPGFPGYGTINASQTLAYMADMQESGVPVTYGYIADIHGNEQINDPATNAACAGLSSEAALGSGSPCYIAQAQYYDQAFETFFQRLAAAGITPANTLFVFSSDEGDHESGANVGRALQPTPANCDGATVSGTTVTADVACTYAAGSFGELAGNLTGLLATEKGDTTPFSLENDTAPEFYVTGNPSAASPPVRSLERDVAGLTADNPYSGNPNEQIANYLADPTEEAILHMVTADPARTPTFSLFAKPDYYLATGSTTCSGSCVTQNSHYGWDHGDYAAEIDTNYLGLVGPGVANLGLDGSGPAQGPSSAGPDSGQVTVPGEGTTGPWLDETDIRPTMLYLAGLTDDYQSDGRVVTEVLANPNSALSTPGLTTLGACYKQLNSSVGVFGTATLQADTNAMETASVGDLSYTSTVSQLGQLDLARDDLATSIKGQLDRAAFKDSPPGATTIRDETGLCQFLLGQATNLAATS
jgi:hypothetical protein